MKVFYIFSVFLVVSFLTMIYFLFGVDTKNTTGNINVITSTNANSTTNTMNSNTTATNSANISNASLQKKEVPFRACYSLATIGENQKSINDTLSHFQDVSKKVSTNEERAIVYFDLGQDKAHANALFTQYQNSIFKGFNVEQDGSSYIVKVATLGNYNSAKTQVDGLNVAMKDKNIDGTWYAKNITKMNYLMTINSVKSENLLTEALKNQGKLSKVSCE